MSDKEFGIKFTKTDNGFKIEVSGDEELVNAHREMGAAWKEFVRKARDVAEVHHRHHHHHSPWHHSHYDEKKSDETVDIQPETKND